MFLLCFNPNKQIINLMLGVKFFFTNIRMPLFPPSPNENQQVFFVFSSAACVCPCVFVIDTRRHPRAAAKILRASTTRFFSLTLEFFNFIWISKKKKMIWFFFTIFKEQWFITQDQIWAVALFARLTEESLQECFPTCAYRGQHHRGPQKRKRDTIWRLSAIGNSCSLSLSPCVLH